MKNSTSSLYPQNIGAVMAALCIMIAALTACMPSSPKKEAASVKDLLWLQGEWINDTDSPSLTFETWQWKDSALHGSSFALEGNDTIFSEEMEIKMLGKVLCYIPTVQNQNEGNPVVFKLTSTDGNYFAFSNPQHDFPQTIVYQQKGADSLWAFIEGETHGRKRKINFPFKRK